MACLALLLLNKEEESSEQFRNTYQAHISAYGSLVMIGLEARKYSETRYNKVISTVDIIITLLTYYV